MSSQRCPRRDEGFGFAEKGTPDRWRERDHHAVCSYCGSMHPDDFLKAAESGATLGPTDKSYKVYVDLPHPKPEELCIVASRNFAPPVNEAGWELLTAKAFAEFESDEPGRFRADEINRYWFKRAPNGPVLHAKFYFQHLNEEQMRAFITLLNAKKLTVGNPGHFYVRPFFIAQASAA